jgi:hypothetical protein
MRPQTNFGKPPFTSLIDHLAAPDTARTFRQRDRWSRLVARDRRIKRMHRDVLRSLALCARTDGDGRLVIAPTHVALAKAADCSERTAYRAIDSAEEAGIVRKKRHSDGRVSNAYELLLPGSNPAKFPVPTLPNLDDANCGNPVTADRVLSVERKQGYTVYEETVCINNCTSDAAPTAETPNDRAIALIDQPDEQEQHSPSASKSIGTATNGANGAHAGPGFDALCRNARQVFGTKGDAVAARLLAALGGDVEDTLDTLAAAADEADPMGYLKMEVERLREGYNVGG